jgi:hypothetical protein
LVLFLCKKANKTILLKGGNLMADIFTYDLDIDMKQEFGMGYDIQCHQLDTITLNCSIWNEGTIFDATNFTVELDAKRPDGNDYIQSKYNIETGLGYVKINCTDQLTVASGKIKAQLRIYNETLKQRTSRIIYIQIIPSVLEVDRRVSESTITALQYAESTLNRLNESDLELTNSISKANTAKSNLDNSTSLANTAKSNLDTSKNIADTANSTLNSSIDMAKDVIADLSQVNSKYTTHINNNDIHVTKNDKNNWNRMNDVVGLLDILFAGTIVTDETNSNITTETGEIWTL